MLSHEILMGVYISEPFVLLLISLFTHCYYWVGSRNACWSYICAWFHAYKIPMQQKHKPPVFQVGDDKDGCRYIEGGFDIEDNRVSETVDFSCENRLH